MRSVSQLNGSSLNASDGEIGTVKQAYFDDEAWTIRYLVVDTGPWLTGREVLILPSAVKQPLGSAKIVEVSLTREQVENSPPVDTHKPVSRQHEREHLDHYGSSIYLGRPGLMALGVHPMAPIVAASEFERDRSESENVTAPGDEHLRSTAKVSGYEILATDGSIGPEYDASTADERDYDAQLYDAGRIGGHWS